jgi:Ca-activated chloride channel family protein
MYFQYPAILLLLWLLPGVAALLILAQKRRVAAARRFVEQPMIARLMPDLHGARPWTKGGLMLLGFALLIVAAARPQYGVYYEKVKQQHGADCFVLLDVSRSMLAEDVVPNRLSRAKSDILDLLKKLGGDRVGLIVFAGKPVLKVPLTTDAGFFDMVLDDIDTRSAPRGGTLIGDAIRKALDLLPPRGDHDQILVLLTDGEDQDSYPLDAAKQAAERGVKIFTVGLGDSSEGARIPVRNASGKLEYVKEEGKEHWSKTDQSVLKQIANVTGGAHVSAGTRMYDLGQIYQDRLAGLTRGDEQGEVSRRRFNDHYQVFLALALVLLTSASLLASVKGDSPIVADTKTRTVPRRAVRLLATLLAPFAFGLSSLGAAPASAAFGSVAREVEQGIGAFRGGDFKAASEAFGKAAEALPNEPRIAFDRGCAFAGQGENDKAIEQFQIAAAAQNRPLAATADYNLGCLAIAKAKKTFGQKPEEAKSEARKEGLESLEQATGHLRDCLSIDPEHADARYNLEGIQVWKKQMQEVWRQRDLQKRRQEMNLLQFLQWMEKEQRDLRAKDRPLASEPASPRRREAIRAVENAQRELTDEIAPLKEKLHAALTAPAAAPGGAAQPVAASPQPPEPEAEKALTLLNKLADEAHDGMNAAADALAAQKPLDVAKPQADAIERLDSIFMVVSPFVELVKKGIAAEEGLIAQSKDAADGTKSTKSEHNTNGTKGEKDAKIGNGKTDWGEAAWNQRFISNYGRVLAAKAKRTLEQLAKTPPVSPGPTKTPGSPDFKDASPAGKNAGANQQANAEAQQKEIKRELQAGVDLAPKVMHSSNEAISHLEASHLVAALPPQEETLKLLKEMLPKQDQKKNDQNKDKQDKDKKDQDKKNQDQKDRDKKDRKDKSKQEKKNQKKQQENPKQADKQEQPGRQKLQDPSKQQAEAAMRKVRERQQDRREKEKVLLEQLYRPEKVDKDW